MAGKRLIQFPTPDVHHGRPRVRGSIRGGAGRTAGLGRRIGQFAGQIPTIRLYSSRRPSDRPIRKFEAFRLLRLARAFQAARDVGAFFR